MIKEVPCMECDGKGFITKFGEYSVWSERCPNCGGTGIVKVPMTNADRIRAMDDEQLAKLFYSVYKRSCIDFVNQSGIKAEIKFKNSEASETAFLKYLQSPAVKED